MAASAFTAGSNVPRGRIFQKVDSNIIAGLGSMLGVTDIYRIWVVSDVSGNERIMSTSGLEVIRLRTFNGSSTRRLA